MSYESSFEVLDNYIRIEVFGERVPGDVGADSGEVVQQTLQVIEKTGITNCLLVPASDELPDPAQERACIRCGYCTDACPASSRVCRRTAGSLSGEP